MKNKVIAEAEKWVGYLEKANSNQLESFDQNAGYNNYTIFAKQYKEYFNINFQGQPWCAMFVSCVFRNALGQNVQQTIRPHFSYCPTGVNQFKNLKCWYVNNPQVGDVIFFKDSVGVSCHVGIVYKVQNNKVYTIEGNTSDKNGVIANGGAVCKKQYNINYERIMGYGRPKYQVLKSPPWQEDFLLKLVNKGYIQNKIEWSKYEEPVSKGLCVALIDKITGGKWVSKEANSNIHWSHPHLISLCGKNIIQQREAWETTLEDSISNGAILALIDKATGGTIERYLNITYKHWANVHLNSLVEKGIVETPDAWCDNFDSNLTKGSFMALVCKAYNI